MAHGSSAAVALHRCSAHCSTQRHEAAQHGFCNCWCQTKASRTKGSHAAAPCNGKGVDNNSFQRQGCAAACASTLGLRVAQGSGHAYRECTNTRFLYSKVVCTSSQTRWVLPRQLRLPCMQSATPGHYAVHSLLRPCMHNKRCSVEGNCNILR